MDNIQEVTAAELANIDGIVVIDHSGSMSSSSLRFANKTRMQELQEDVSAVAREFAKYDADGLTVIPFSSIAKVIDGVTAERVAQVFSENQPRGSTNLAAALTEAVKKAAASSKEAVVLVYTDGEPDDVAAATAIIEQAGKDLGRPKIGFVFVQVGTSPDATTFLQYLDNKMSVDVCATVSAKDAETLSVPQLAWLARNK